MFINATEFKNNLGKYLLLAETTDIFITRNGKIVVKLINPNQDRVKMAESLFGILPDNRAKKDFARYEGNNQYLRHRGCLAKKVSRSFPMRKEISFLVQI